MRGIGVDDRAQEGVRAKGGGGCAYFVCGLSRMTMGPRIPTMQEGARWVFTDQDGIACNNREAP